MKYNHGHGVDKSEPERPIARGEPPQLVLDYRRKFKAGGSVSGVRGGHGRRDMEGVGRGAHSTDQVRSEVGLVEFLGV